MEGKCLKMGEKSPQNGVGKSQNSGKSLHNGVGIAMVGKCPKILRGEEITRCWENALKS